MTQELVVRPSGLLVPDTTTQPLPDVEERFYGGRTSLYGYGGLTSGGLVNTTTGLGTSLDKTEGFFLRPTRFAWAGPMEILCVQSWAARRARDLLVDDMFIRWRQFVDEDNETTVEKMIEAEERHDVTAALGDAMKAARQHGTGAVILMTTEAPMDWPLVPEQIREGDLKNLLVVDRWELAQTTWDRDPYSKQYGKSEWYDVFPTLGGSFRVHHSRMLRFDGMTAPTSSGFRWYDQEWGVPDLVPIILALLQDQAFVSAISHLGQEASIPILKVPDLNKALSGKLHQNDPNARSVESIGEKINMAKSIYRLMMIDRNQEFVREAVQFAGLGQVFDKFPQRVAAAVGVPQTRWWGRSPAGLNATGESDMRDYVIELEANRERQMRRHDKLTKLDMVLARDAGMREPPEFEWLSLLELSDQDRLELAFKRVETVVKAVDGGMIDEDEGREILKGDPLFADLRGNAPEADFDELMANLPPELQPGPDNEQEDEEE